MIVEVYGEQSFADDDMDRIAALDLDPRYLHHSKPEATYMCPTRRQFQVGQSRFEAREESDGWHVYVRWWEINRRLEKDERDEHISGPHPEFDARHRAAELQLIGDAGEERRRERAKVIACA